MNGRNKNADRQQRTGRTERGKQQTDFILSVHGTQAGVAEAEITCHAGTDKKIGKSADDAGSIRAQGGEFFTDKARGNVGIAAFTWAA